MAEAPAGKKFELGTAYVSIMASFDGIAADLSRSISRGIAGATVDPQATEAVSRRLGDGINRGLKTINFGGLGGQFLSGMKTAISPLNNALASTVKGAAGLFGDTLTIGAKSAGIALTGAVAAVGTQMVAGGFSRAMGINEATAGLKAMGYEGEQFKNIMDAAGNSVDGTAYSMDQSVLAARNFMAAGVPEEKLEGYLKNIGKLADMGTRSYSDISTILQSMAATDVVQGGDFLQLAQAGIPIYTAMAETLGVSVAEVKKLGSEGKITFADLNKSIDAIDWDSATFAALDVSSAWGNVKSQLSKIGANLWTPIIDGLPGILGDVRTFLSTFNKSFDFNPIQTKLSGFMEKISSIFDIFRSDDGALDTGKVKTAIDSLLLNFDYLSDRLDDYKGIITGALIGIGGGLLSGIPIIGPMFARLTPIVGLFAGVLYSAWENSEDLRNAVSSLGAYFKNLGEDIFKGSADFDAQDFFKNIGDGLGKAIGWIQEFIEDFVDKMSENMPHISETISTMFDGIGKAFQGAGENGLDGEALADLFTQIVEIFGTYAPLAFEVLLSAASSVGEILKSDWFNGLVNWLGGAFRNLAANEEVITTGITIAAGLFIGGKLLPVFSGMLGFVMALKGMSPGFRVAGRASSGIAGSMKGFLVGIVKIVAVVALIIAAIAGIGLLMEKTGFMKYLNTFVSEVSNFVNEIAKGWAKVVETLMPVVTSILTFVGELIVDLIEGLVSAILGPLALFIAVVGFVISDLMEAGTGLADALSGLADAGSSFIDSINKFLLVLAINGEAAGKGAHAAAGGIGELMKAIAGGGLATAGTSFLGGLASKLTGGDGVDPFSKVVELVQSISNLADIAIVFPVIFQKMLQEGVVFGSMLPTVIANGIRMGAPLVAMAMTTAIKQALQTQQVMLDSNPLTVRLKVDSSALANVRVASATATKNGMGTNNITNNYRISNGSDALSEKLLKEARGR